MNPNPISIPNLIVKTTPEQPESRPSLGLRLRWKVGCMIAHDRRVWDELMRRFAAEDRWICRSVKALFRPTR
ncbi:MAG: hypothetical protein H6648_06695 [Caldilineae bacterium]|nr:hypothetical protein [Chloroflexota bacterium]MCB9176833.1 hypothetical protein [Caldilineae bacterium]